MKKELYITDLIRRIKTTEGLLREKLEIDDQRWEESMQKYSIFRRLNYFSMSLPIKCHKVTQKRT